MNTKSEIKFTADVPRFRIIPKAERDRVNSHIPSRKRRYMLLEEVKYPIPFYTPLILHGNMICHHGVLTLKNGFTWDGASGPAIDTATFIIPSAVHDALYFLITAGFFDSVYLSPRLNKLKRRAYRKIADIVLAEMCGRYNMKWLRRWYVYYAVRAFGWLHI